jgi:hypothetical protein
MARRHTIQETAVIFQSVEDECWIAHGLRTDQIGTGDSIVNALADLIRALEAVAAQARRDPSISLLRKAPPEIQARAKTARKLPQELYEIAHRRAKGSWPAELIVGVEPQGRNKSLVFPVTV